MKNKKTKLVNGSLKFDKSTLLELNKESLRHVEGGALGCGDKPPTEKTLSTIICRPGGIK